MEVKFKYLMKVLRAANDGKFILIKLWQFGKKQGIAIKYTTFYVYKKTILLKEDNIQLSL